MCTDQILDGKYWDKIGKEGYNVNAFPNTNREGSYRSDSLTEIPRDTNGEDLPNSQVNSKV